jgi:5-methylcytosine-specific restriction endonuclease McrA
MFDIIVLMSYVIDANEVANMYNLDTPSGGGFIRWRGVLSLHEMKIMDTDKKICNVCGVAKVYSDFTKSRNSFSATCRKCRGVKRRYDLANTPKSLQARKERIYRESNGLKKCSYCKKTKNKTDFDGLKKSKDGLNYRCRTCHTIANKKSLLNHPDSQRKRSREYFKKNKNSVMDKLRIYRKTPKGMSVVAQGNFKRRSLMDNTKSEQSDIDLWLVKIYSKPTFRCYYCQDTYKTKFVHIDHVEPLSKGGTNVISNLCASCSSCNLRKHTHSAAEFKNSQQGQHILAI